MTISTGPMTAAEYAEFVLMMPGAWGEYRDVSAGEGARWAESLRGAAAMRRVAFRGLDAPVQRDNHPESKGAWAWERAAGVPFGWFGR